MDSLKLLWFILVFIRDQAARVGGDDYQILKVSAHIFNSSSGILQAGSASCVRCSQRLLFLRRSLSSFRE